MQYVTSFTDVTPLCNFFRTPCILKHTSKYKKRSQTSRNSGGGAADTNTGATEHGWKEFSGIKIGNHVH